MPFAGSDIMKMAVIPMNEKGAILGGPWQYRNPPFLTLPGNPPLEEVTLYDFKVNEIPEPEDIDNIPEDYGKELVEVMEKKVRAYTYYCDLDADADWDDSIFWNGGKHTDEEIKACLDARNKSGDGSKENPWKNLTWALEQVECICSNLCCQYVRIICSGTAYYTARIYKDELYLGFGGNKHFILENANVNVSNKRESYCFYRMTGTFFHKCNAVFENSEITEYCYSSFFSDCNNGFFYQCQLKCNATVNMYDQFQDFEHQGFVYCNNSKFYKCVYNMNSNVAVKDPRDLYAFSSSSCIYYECDAVIYSKNADIMVYSGGSEFYKCNITFMGDNSDITGIYSTFGRAYNCNLDFSSVNSLSVYFIYCETAYNCNIKYTGSRSYHGSSYITGLSCEKLYNCTAEIEANNFWSITGYYDFIKCHNCNSNITLETGFQGTVVGFDGRNGEKPVEIISNCSCTCVCSSTSSGSAVAYVYGYRNDSRIYNNEVLNNFSYTISASAESTGSADYTEEEYECGVYIYPECKEGYRCERRRNGSTESC